MRSVWSNRDGRLWPQRPSAGLWLRRLVRVSPQALDDFVHPTRYDTTNASRDLAPGRVAVPRFSAYVDRLVEFMKAHPEIGSAGLR